MKRSVHPAFVAGVVVVVLGVAVYFGYNAMQPHREPIPRMSWEQMDYRKHYGMPTQPGGVTGAPGQNGK